MAKKRRQTGPSVPPETGDDQTKGDNLHDHISRAAYFRAAARGFKPGRELDDWLEAEREIRRAGRSQVSQDA